MFGNKNSYKDIILEVQRKDKIVSYCTKGLRKKEGHDFYFEIISPFNKKTRFKMADIPAEYFSSGGAVHVYTPDLEQFYPVSPAIIKNDMLLEQVLTNEQKEWLKKAYRRDAERGKEESWLQRHKEVAVALIIMGAVVLSVWFITSNLNASINFLGNTIDKVGAKLSGVPVSSTPKPPA